MYDLAANARLAAEFTQFTGDRVGKPDPDGRSYAAEVRYRF